jgi:polyisoprenyl-phosphate glycosyltransferase
MTGHSESHRQQREETLLSVVLPVYNEAKVLPVLAARVAEVLSHCWLDFEIVFVNDGSTDDSTRVLDQLAATSEKIRVIHLSRNFGSQAAILAGLTYARGEAVVLMKSNLQDPPEAIPSFLTEWGAGYDVVYAVWKHHPQRLLKRLFFATFHWLTSTAASTTPISPEEGIFGLIDRRVAQQIIAMSEKDRYFPGLRTWVGFRQKGVEVQRNARSDRRLSASMLEQMRSAGNLMFSFSSFPLKVFHGIGALALMVFVLLGGWALFSKLFTHQAIPGWTSIVLTGSFFGALNALGISILGEYVVRIHDQVRGRPMYLVDRTVNMHGTASEDRSGDEPYRELMQQAMDLLDEGAVSENLENGNDPLKDLDHAELLSFQSNDSYR